MYSPFSNMPSYDFLPFQQVWKLWDYNCNVTISKNGVLPFVTVDLSIDWIYILFKETVQNIIFYLFIFIGLIG